MKKFLIVLLTLALLLNGLLAFAETDTETDTERGIEMAEEEAAEDVENPEEGSGATINWSDVEFLVDALRAEGDFYLYRAFGFKMWVPAAFPQTDLSEEQMDNGWIDMFIDESGTNGIVVSRTQYEDLQTLEDLKDAFKAMTHGIDYATINGIRALVYQHEDDNCLTVVLPLNPGDFLSITYNGISDQAVMNLTGISMASIQVVDEEEMD